MAQTEITDFVTDDGQDTFNPEVETVTDAWEGVYIYTSWGYGQTNVNFAQIIEVSDTGKTVLARRVGAERIGHDRTNEQLRPTADQYGDKFRLHVRVRSVGDGPTFRGSYPYVNGNKDDGTRRDSFVPFSNSPENTVRQTAPNYGH